MDNSKKQMEMLFDEGGIADDGMNVDPVSGNEIPPGSMASEVRDDIPAQLSEGEYVVPADVLRFYGVKFFEDLRLEAKQGMAKMEADGRIGGEPVGMEDPREAESALTPEEMSVLQEMGMAVGGMVPQPTQSTDPYMQQQSMYQQPSPVAMGNRGYSIGGGVTAFDPSMYGAGFSFLSTPTETAPETRIVMLYSPDGLTTQSFSLPAQQTEYESKLTEGWTTTPIQTPQVTGGNDDPPIKPDTGEGNKPFSEMSGEELQNALNQNKKAHTLMQGMTAINPMLGIAGLAATRYAEKQILENMKKKGVEPVEPVEAADEGGIISNLFSTLFGTKKDKDPVVTPSSITAATAAETAAIQEGGGATGDDDGPTVISGGGTGGGDKYVFSEDTTDYSATDDDVFDDIDAEFEAAAANPAPSSGGGGGKATGGLMQKKKKKKK